MARLMCSLWLLVTSPLVISENGNELPFKRCFSSSPSIRGADYLMWAAVNRSSPYRLMFFFGFQHNLRMWTEPGEEALLINSTRALIRSELSPASASHCDLRFLTSCLHGWEMWTGGIPVWEAERGCIWWRAGIEELNWGMWIWFTRKLKEEEASFAGYEDNVCKAIL